MVDKTLYIGKHGFETSSKPWDEEDIKEQYKAEPIGKGLYLGKKLDLYNDGRVIQHIYSKEVGYGGGDTFKWVGSLNHTEKKYNHNHGYFVPHPTGKKIRKYAIDNGFTLR